MNNDPSAEPLFQININWDPDENYDPDWRRMTKEAYLREWGLGQEEWDEMVKAGSIYPSGKAVPRRCEGVYLNIPGGGDVKCTVCGRRPDRLRMEQIGKACGSDRAERERDEAIAAIRQVDAEITLGVWQASDSPTDR